MSTKKEKSKVITGNYSQSDIDYAIKIVRRGRELEKKFNSEGRSLIGFKHDEEAKG